MAGKSDFTAAEWKLIVDSAMLVGIAVSAAEPSGLWGVLRESFASGNALARARLDAHPAALVEAVMAELDTAEGRSAARQGVTEHLSGAAPDEISARCVAVLGEVGALLDAKAPDDGPAFKAWLRQIGQDVAEASREGGFLGFGGTPVSDAERATIAEIATALRLPA